MAWYHTAMGNSQKFLSLYKKLNKEQKKAVDCVEGPVMVIAGPGTGKTQILTLRIANILRKTDTAPGSILALTFTESGVFSMRRRLVEIIGSAGYRVRIHTFHGFANDVIERYPDEFPKIIGARNVNEVEKIAILKKIILSLPSPLLRPYGDTFYYIPHIRRKISELKREYITPDVFARFVAKQKGEFQALPDLYHERGAHQGEMRGAYTRLAKQLERNGELLAVYARYEEELMKERLYDFDDMIVEVVRALEGSPDLLLRLQEEHQYILADEHQDANNSQNRLLALLASFHDNPNLFIVGDEKQAIFRFQGASLENFLYFKRRYPKALVVTLKDNYRSTQYILDAAHSLIKANAGPKNLHIRLMSHGTVKETPVVVAAFSRPELEYASIARDIGEKIKRGVPPEEIAVLYRDNKDAASIARIFEKTNIPFVILSDQNILRDPLIARLLLLLRTVNDFGNSELLARTLHLDFLGVNNLDLYKLIHYAGRQRAGSPFLKRVGGGYGFSKKELPASDRSTRGTLYDVLSDPTALKKAGIRTGKKLHALYTKLDAWKTASMNCPVLDFLSHIMEESGFLEAVVRENESLENLGKISALFDDIKTLVVGHKEYVLADAIAYFDTLEEHNLPIQSRSRGGHAGKVRLMTAHKAKGLEFDYVYIVNAYDGHWGNKRTLEYFLTPVSTQEFVADGKDEDDDERRLFYVALTRARVGVSVSYAKEGEEGALRLPTRFIGEITPRFLREEETGQFEKSIAKQFFLSPAPRRNAPLKNKEFLNALFLEQGLSVTALNNYLSCPWNYFYRNLIRIPQPPEKHASLGTAVHGALKDFFDALRHAEAQGEGGLRDEKNPDEEHLLLSFERRLKQEPLGEKDYEESLLKGKTALSGYFKNSVNAWRADVRAELKIETLFPVDSLSVSIPLRGILDRVEEREDGGICVIDYKTGKPKSRNEIEGNTKNSRGDYKRQLVFYKLLLSLSATAPVENSAQGRALRRTVGNSRKAVPYGVRYGLAQNFPRVFLGVISFIEPDQSGRYREEAFEISDEEVAELSALIQKTAEEIHSLSFWNKRCGDGACKYCMMRETLK
ncbi:MAG: ATP-dependent helicase [Parcubacteria group bacterium]|nr:ATP-dependent helicase [Parcubacteria group bacterium]